MVEISAAPSSSSAAARVRPEASGAAPPRRRRRMPPPALLAGAGLLLLLCLLAALAPWIRPEGPLAIAGPRLTPPFVDLRHPFGTDQLGRDVLAGLLYGARVSLAVGAVATAVAIGAGALIGALGGYFGGLGDDLCVRIMEVFQTIPGFLLLVLLMAIASPSIPTIILGIALVSWDSTARLVRAETRSIRSRDYVAAAIVSGQGHFAILRRDVLPNILPVILVSATLMVPQAIMLESALSFMGLGDPSRMTWGRMIGEGREMLRSQPLLAAIPGVFVLLSAIGFNLLAEGLRRSFVDVGARR